MHRAIVIALGLLLVAGLSVGCGKKVPATGPIEPRDVVGAGETQGPGGGGQPAEKPAGQEQQETGEVDLSGMKVAIVIAPEGFRDEEFIEPRKALMDAGAEVTVVSLRKGECHGAGGARPEADATPDEIDPAEYDGIVFVGGPGMYKLLDNEKFIALAKKFAEDDKKIIAAICVSPAILANAGLLKGVKATAWKDVRPVLAAKGAEVIEDQPVVVSGRFITANGPKAAPAYARAIVSALAAKKKAVEQQQEQ